MRTNRKDLINILSKLMPGLAKKEIVEQATHFIFNGTEVATYNDMVCIIHPFNSGLDFSVRGDEFYKLLRDIEESEVDITLEDGHVRVKSKSTNAVLSTSVEESAKVVHLLSEIRSKSIDSKNYMALPPEFLNAVYLCSFAANKDLATGTRSCVAIRDDAVYAADMERCSMYILESAIDTMLLPATSAATLAKYNVNRYCITDNWAHFRNDDGVSFSCKMVLGDYPYDKVASIFSDKDPSLRFPKELKGVISSMLIFTEDDINTNKVITVDITTDVITLTARKERGEIVKQFAFEYKGEPITFHINPIFFAQVLDHANDFVLVNAGLAQFISDNFYHVLSLPIKK